jgi:hypothetical protein
MLITNIKLTEIDKNESGYSYSMVLSEPIVLSECDSDFWEIIIKHIFTKLEKKPDFWYDCKFMITVSGLTFKSDYEIILEIQDKINGEYGDDFKVISDSTETYFKILEYGELHFYKKLDWF